MKYTYYPGCSLTSTGRSYDESIREVFRVLEIELDELDDWNCCGATAYMAVNEMAAFALAARNLALAEKVESNGAVQDMMAPCSACYLVLNKAQHFLEDYDNGGSVIRDALVAVGLNYEGKVKVRHPLDILVNDLGLDSVKEKVTESLDGLKVACYYGCQIVRPYATFDDQNDPRTMDILVEALGAESVTWPLKTRCCGGSLTGTIQDVGLRLNYILLNEAKKRGADVIATACPLCQFNLECYQDKIAHKFGNGTPMPIMYFSQLMGKAFGSPENVLGIHRNFVPLKSEMAGIEGGRNA